MGQYLFDQYSLLHFASGVIFYFWGFSFLISLILHILFEYFENTEFGIRFININLANIWPGGKPKADSYLNQFGDNLFFAIGFICSQLLDSYGKYKKWY